MKQTAGKKKWRIVALIAAAALLLLLSEGLFGHSCTGEGCPVCALCAARRAAAVLLVLLAAADLYVHTERAGGIFPHPVLFFFTPVLCHTKQTA